MVGEIDDIGGLAACRRPEVVALVAGVPEAFSTEAALLRSEAMEPVADDIAAEAAHSASCLLYAQNDAFF